MKRVITLSVFITLVLIVMLAKTSHAQRRVIYAHASPTATLRIWTPGFGSGRHASNGMSG